MKKLVQSAAILMLSVAAYQLPAIHAQDQPHVIKIQAKRFSFTPSEITLTQGQTTKLAITSVDVTHGLVIPELGVNVTLPKGKLIEVEVTPQQIGTFHGQCGHFCGVGHASMTFSVEVKAK
jgi:cytochrome c oxidase subunit 2